MSDLLFNYPVQPFEERALIRQHLDDNRRAQVIGLEAHEIRERGNEIVRQGFNDLVSSTREAVQAYEESQEALLDEVDGVNSALADVSSELRDIKTDVGEGLATVDDTLTKGFIATNAVLGTGFAVVSSFLDDVAGELSDLHCDISDGFERLGVLFDWGFAELIVQAELQNQNLKEIIKILLMPATTEARDLLHHAIQKNKRRFVDEALESFLFLLEEKKYRVVLGTYFPIHRFIADIYLFDKKRYDEAMKYYELALKYAPPEAVRLKALLCLCVGRCHYYLKEFIAARDSAKRSLESIFSTEAQYQYAKYCALAGDAKEALLNLASLIRNDKFYVFKVVNDQDFTDIKDGVLELLVRFRQVRDAKVLRRSLLEREKLVKEEIEKNRTLQIDAQELEDLSRELVQGIVEIELFLVRNGERMDG